ncbi:MAG: tripartite tricarboxylate transporter TctB family protein [Caldimonas sp.]
MDTAHAQTDEESVASHGESIARTPLEQAGLDLRGAIGWVVVGIAVLVGSITMDRLEQQNINKYTIPGLVPGLLGIAMILLGLVLGVRSWRQGGAGAPKPPIDRAVIRRLGLVLVLVVVFAVGLVGHGMPFWLGATAFVTASILMLQAPQRAATGLPPYALRQCLFAAAIGLGSGLVVTYVFQELFLVRLP